MTNVYRVDEPRRALIETRIGRKASFEALFPGTETKLGRFSIYQAIGSLGISHDTKIFQTATQQE